MIDIKSHHSGVALANRVDVDAAMRRLHAVRDGNGPTTGAVDATARRLGMSTRTVWRWLSGGASCTDGSTRWEPSDEDIDAFVRWKANAAAAWRERSRSNPTLPGLRTFQRGISQQLRTADQAVIAEGVPGRRRHQVYLRWEPAARNDIWEADHKQLDIHVIYPRCTKPVRPWVTTFLDGYSRAIMGWAIDRHPSGATALAALGEAIRLDPPRGPFGGTPLVIRPDRGLEFTSSTLDAACSSLGIDVAPTWPYKPYLKGKVERLHLTFETEFVSGLPHYTGGPRDAAGRLWGGGQPLGIHDLVEQFDLWVTAYNLNRAHQELNGQTPQQRWTEGATPLRIIDDSDLRWLLMGNEERKVRTSGVRFHGFDFIAPELNGLVGQQVEVRYRPHDDTSIEVFAGGRHLCTAYPQGQLSAEQRAAVLQRRRDDAAEQAKRQRRAARRARQRLAPVTTANDVRDVTVITTTGAIAERTRWHDQDLRTAAAVDLLNLPSNRG